MNTLSKACGAVLLLLGVVQLLTVGYMTIQAPSHGLTLRLVDYYIAFAPSLLLILMGYFFFKIHRATLIVVGLYALLKVADPYLSSVLTRRPFSLEDALRSQVATFSLVVWGILIGLALVAWMSRKPSRSEIAAT
jgi:hypothetical protein